MKKIGIIGGTGWMGKAAALAMLETGFIAEADLWVANQSGNNPFSTDYPAIQFTTNLQELVEACDVIILSVLPRQFPALAIHCQQQLVISFMACVSIKNIADLTGANKIIRSMPNAALAERQSYTPWFATEYVSPEEKVFVNHLFACLGMAAEMRNEEQINVLTALTGSSHGWLAYVANALMEFGAEQGLPENITEPAIRQVMKGIGQLLAHEKASAKETVKIVTDYAGTTAAGIHCFNSQHVAESIKQGLKASYKKASETL